MERCPTCQQRIKQVPFCRICYKCQKRIERHHKYTFENIIVNSNSITAEKITATVFTHRHCDYPFELVAPLAPKMPPATKEELEKILQEDKTPCVIMSDGSVRNGWFAKDTKPKCRGVYRTSRTDIPTKHGAIAYSFWDGKQWSKWEGWGEYHHANTFIWQGMGTGFDEPVFGKTDL